MATIDALNNQTQSTGFAVGTVLNADGSVKSTTGSNQTLQDKNTFLKLLVAQLKYQDPSKPADPSEFMSQTAQFSQLESLQNLEKETTKMLNAQQSVTATSLIGKKITGTPTLGGADVTGVVTGIKLGTDGPVIKIGDTEVEFGSVKEVKAP